VLTKTQIEAIVRYAEQQPKYGDGLAAEALRIGITPGSLKVLVCNWRAGRRRKSWLKALEETTE
jgi:hypothetical protein